MHSSLITRWVKEAREKLPGIFSERGEKNREKDKLIEELYQCIGQLSVECECLDEALEYGRPEIFNTDQGSQFTSAEFTGRLTQHNISISMDGRGRVFDNIFTECLWRSVKYENIYIKGYQIIPEAQLGLKEYFGLYNTMRLHESLNYQTPWEIYSGLGRLDLLLKTIVLSKP